MEQLKKNKDLTIIYVCAIVSSIILIVGWGVLETPDSPGYVSAWDNNYVNGHIDIFRTPVYPIFLGVIKEIFGESHFLFIAICIQHIIFLFSLKYFYKAAMLIVGSDKIVFWLTLFYGVFPCVTTWNNFILTESFAFSGTVFLLYVVLRLSHKYSVVSMLIFTILLFLLIFLRPALVYMLPVLWVSWIFRAVKNRSVLTALYGTLSVSIVSLSLITYMKVFEKEYGLFTSSSVSTFNQKFIAYEDDLLNPDITEDPQLKKDIIEKNIWGKYDLKTVDKVIMDSYKSQPVKYIQKCFGRLYRSKQKSLFLTLAPGFATVFDMIGFNLNTLYLFLIIYTGIVIYWMIKRRTFPQITALMYMLGVSNIIVVIIGAPEEWERLIIPSMPLFLLMFGQICTMFKSSPVASIKFQ